MGGGGVHIFGAFLASFLRREILPFDKEFANLSYGSSYLPNSIGKNLLYLFGVSLFQIDAQSSDYISLVVVWVKVVTTLTFTYLI